MSQYTLCRALFNNMVEGLSTGFTKTLTLIGVGYRAVLAGKNLQLNLGYSNPVIMAIPNGIEVKASHVLLFNTTAAEILSKQCFS